MKTFSLPRRRFLGLAACTAGALVAHPLTRHLRANGPPTKRFVLFVEGNGTEPVTMLSPSARSALDAALTESIGTRRNWYASYQHESALELMTPDLDQAKSLASLGALSARAAVVYGLSSKVSGGGHNNYHGGLSCTRTISLKPGGVTIDTVLGEQVQGATPFDVLRVGTSNDRGALSFGASALRKGVALPHINSPSVARDVVFAPIVNRAAFAERDTVLDVARRDADRVLREFPTGAEREKVERYASSIETLLTRQQALKEAAEGLEAPDAPADNLTRLGQFHYQAELVTAALLGGLTNVAVVGMGLGTSDVSFNLTYSDQFQSRARHGLHHESEDDPALADIIHAVTAEQIRAMTNMAQVLAATPDPQGGDMLEHTVMIYLPNTGERHHSRAEEFPMLLLGGEQVGLKTGGRTVVFPGESYTGHRQLSNIWNTFGHLAGLDLNDFGAETEMTRRALGPLSELLV